MIEIDNTKIYEWIGVSPSGAEWIDVKWIPEKGFFLAVAYTGEIAKSTDGKSWATLPNTGSNIYSISYSDPLGLYVVCGDGINNIWWSTDLITWTKGSASDVSLSLHEIIWINEKSMFAAVNNDLEATVYRVWTSLDGKNWTGRCQAAGRCHGIAWAPEISTAVVVSSSRANHHVSTDLVNWTTYTNTPANNYWFSIAWSPSLMLFAACGQTGTNNRIMTSPDGITWTLRYTPVDSVYYDISWSSELLVFIASATSGTEHMLTSDDGINWVATSSLSSTPISSTSYSPQLNLSAMVGNSNLGYSISPVRQPPSKVPGLYFIDICYSDTVGLFCAVAVRNGTLPKIYTSQDGVNWSHRLDITTTFQNARCIWQTDKFVVLGNESVFISSDGINWTSYNSKYRGGGQHLLAYSPELGVYCSSDGYKSSVSVDGINWPAEYNVFSFGNYNSNYFGRSILWSSKIQKFIMVGAFNFGSYDIAYSANGTSWTLYNTGFGVQWSDMVYSPELDRFVVVGSATSGCGVAYSNDGVTWIISSSPVGAKISSVAWSKTLGMFVAVHDDGSLYTLYSYDGIVWKSSKCTQGIGWSSVCWANKIEMFVAVSTSGTTRAMFSKDGINWLPSDVINWKVSPGFSTRYIRKIIDAPDKGIIVAGCSAAGVNLGASVVVSVDGASWQQVYTSSAMDLKSLCYSKELNLFIAVCCSNGTNYIIKSSDGYTWSTLASPYAYLNSVCWSAELGMFVAGGISRMYKSTDGINWTQISTVGGTWGSTWSSVCWSKELGKFCIINGTQTATYDGISFSYGTVMGGTDVIWVSEHGKFYCASSAGIYSSLDGINWIAAKSGVTTWSIAWSKSAGVICAMGTTTAYYSTDGVTWTSYPCINNNGAEWSSVEWCEGVGSFIAGGPGSSTCKWPISWSRSVKTYIPVVSSQAQADTDIMILRTDINYHNNISTNIKLFGMFINSASTGLYIASDNDHIIVPEYYDIDKKKMERL